MQNQTDRQHIANKENNSIEGEYYSGKDMFELEKERIKSADKRTEIARLAIEANDAADKRQFDYHIQKLNHDIEFKNQQAKVSAKLLYGIGLVSTAFGALLIYLTFFGTVLQSEIAANLLEKLVTAMSGVGVYLLGKGIFSKLTNQDNEQ